jgi:hypothetical protein
MLGNLAISLIYATTYGVTAVILGLPYALALARSPESSTSSPTSARSWRAFSSASSRSRSVWER